MNTNDNNTPPAASAQEQAPAESAAPAVPEHHDATPVAREVLSAPPEPPVEPSHRRVEDLREEPGDDVGNRMPAGLPAYAQRYFVPQAPRAQGPGPRREGRGGPPQGRRQSGSGGPTPEGTVPRRGRRSRGLQGGAASPPVDDPTAEGQQAEAAGAVSGGDALLAGTTLEGAAPVEGMDAAPVAASSLGVDSAEDATQAEGGDAGLESASVSADGTQSPAKKRRRRRRRKKGPLDASAEPGVPGAEQSADAEGEAHDGDEQAEGEPHDGDEQAGGEPSDGDEQAGGEPSDGDEQAGGERGEGEGEQAEEGRRSRSRHGGPPHAHHEFAPFRVGEEVFGRVHLLTEHAVWVDIAAKAMGLFDRRELTLDEPPVEGDQFIATVASTGVRGGMLVLSRQAADLDEARAKIEAALKDGTLLEGFVTGAVRGGLEVDLGGLRAFAPASHVDLRHGADLGYLVGQRLDWEITHFAKKGRDIVVSRRKALEDQLKHARVEALKTLEPGSVHQGIVRKVADWGVFVSLPDAGGAEGLVHMTEASHDRAARLSSLFKVGETIDVKVLRVDERGKLWLSRKGAVADPWDAVREKYALGTRHKATVARLQPFGAFVELEPGIDGLIHTADLSFKPIDDPSEVLKVGDSLDVVVSSCDSGAHRIGLHPALAASEEEEPRQRVVQYKNVKAVVAQIVEGGLVVRILGVTGRSARAFIPAQHTGTARGGDLRKDFPIGTRIDAKVLEIDPRRGEAKLSIRALKDDNEKQAYQQYRKGVQQEAKFGTFADLLKKG